MGIYINPKDQSKETWLASNAKPIDISGVLSADLFNVGLGADSLLYICLVDNGSFTAAGIAYSAEELERFRRGINGRKHQWYTAPLTKLLEVAPELKHERLT